MLYQQETFDVSIKWLPPMKAVPTFHNSTKAILRNKSITASPKEWEVPLRTNRHVRHGMFKVTLAFVRTLDISKKEHARLLMKVHIAQVSKT